MFCSILQKLLKLMYDLTRKGRAFTWTKIHQETFEEIKTRLLKSPVLHPPDNRGRFQLFLDTSKTAAGSACCQIQNGTPKLIDHASKREPSAAVNYSIAEVELLGLYVNITQFKQLPAKVDCDCTMDHLVLTYVMKSKTEPVCARIKDC